MSREVKESRRSSARGTVRHASRAATGRSRPRRLEPSGIAAGGGLRRAVWAIVPGAREASGCAISTVVSSWRAWREEWPWRRGPPARPPRSERWPPRRRLPHLPAVSPSPSSGRCRSGRSGPRAGWRGSCGSRATASPATSTCSGPTSGRASGSAAPPRAGSARPTGSTARSRSRGFSTTRRSRRRIARYVDHIVTHQRADGWYAPYPADAATKRYDLWAILLANKALVQYHEATGDARVLEAVVRSLRALGGRPRPHAALRVGPLPLVRGAGVGLLRLRAHAASRGSSTSRASCARRASTSRPSTGPTTSRCRRRGAACGSGRSTS